MDEKIDIKKMLEENNIKVDIPFLVDELPPRRNTQYGLKDPP